jgi:hypothetical protein
VCLTADLEAPPSGYPRKILHRLDGQAMLALALKMVARKRLRACEGMVPGKREMAAFADAHGFSVTDMGACFVWLAQNGWVAEKDNILFLDKPARAWLRASMEQRFLMLGECALKDGVVLSHGRVQGAQVFLGKGLKI